ncbi:MAG: 50S ribosomal protein L11 methyltransferase [Hyphomonadaceae bacterium]|nr:50S ribosomal protein L11 methyltransferase [Hyphomonadaceae bacterium]
MHMLSALGGLREIKAAAEAFDRLDPNPAAAVSWFEETPTRFRLVVYAETLQDAASARAMIGHAAPELPVAEEEAPDADWVAHALDGLPAVKAGRFIVAGAHALSASRSGLKKIWIEASEAFGTGHHGSTKGCLIALEHILRTRRIKRVLDVGAGSGVLAIAAAKMGASAYGIEIDPRAARIGEVNVRQNNVRGRVRMRAGDGARLTGRGRYDLAFANILMRPLIALAPTLSRAVEPGGNLVLSGLLHSQAPLVKAAYASRGFVLERRLRLDAWTTLIWRRKRQRA